MIVEMADLVASLTVVLKDEAELLRRRAGNNELRELVQLKLRLVGMLELAIAQHARDGGEWLTFEDDEMRRDFLELVEALNEAANANAAMLERQLEITTEMIAALAMEARRVVGRRASTYRVQGDMTPADIAPPISFNDRF
ncbi:hypothetical protein ASE95_15915 [Sphingomonas sp. Leaf231]|uniref:hypothetical protein n=1 Tax=Sphingomonas sp. Leaf231 TaxID=1736301 RepID=UPI0006FE6EAD|nr:hypothetical protein [Sphingomonas sp. Leaf231]KQN90173.1 hypothetical protein ASE95_15915 [Sphingomonas sp. Leaf231]